MTILSKAKSFVFFKYLFRYSAIFMFSFFAQTAMTSRLFRLVRAKAPEVLISQEEKNRLALLVFRYAQDDLL